MIARYDIEQGSYEWHALKYRRIGGTRAKGLFTDSDTLTNELIAENCEEFMCDFNGYSNPEMERGNELEPEARKKLSEYLGIEFKTCGLIQSTINDLLIISPDGLSLDETISCEIKCPQAKRHAQTCIENEIPLDNIAQSVHYFTVNEKLEKHYFLSYRPENIYKPMFVKMLTRNSLVNLGTKAKPKISSISKASEDAIYIVDKIKTEIEIKLDKLKF